MPRAYRGTYSPDGNQYAYELNGRWDTEWRNYRGGQNKPRIRFRVVLLHALASYVPARCVLDALQEHIVHQSVALQHP